MKFEETFIKGLYKVDLEKRGDSRGFFARFFCADEYSELGLETEIVQINNSYTRDKLTLRGMHYQVYPKGEAKIVRCIKGKLYEVALDLRPDSPTFGKFFGIELSQENRTMLYVPKGFANGFMTLEEDTEMLYLVTEFYSPDFERVVRWDDSKFGIEWPETPLHMSEKDKYAPDFNEVYHLEGMKHYNL